MTDAAPPDLAAHPLTHWTEPLGLPDFSALRDSDFGPVVEAALAAHRAEIEAIAANPEPPTVANTLEALELSGEPLDRALSIFWTKAGADTNPEIQALERDLSPKLARHSAWTHMNPALFARIDALHEARATLGLDPETLRVLEKTWRRFVRQGAKLGEAEKARLAAIGEDLAGLGAQFGQNVLADEAEWTLLLDEADLEGLPESLRDAMAAAAAERGAPGRYALTLSRSLYEPFSAASTRRDLREKAWRGFVARGESRNAEIVKRTLALRAEKAKLLGYPSYAAFKLDETMAKTPEAVMGLLDPVWEKALAKASGDQADMERLAREAGSNDSFAAWDWRFYAEKLRAERFAFDEAALKPYLQLDRMIEAAFDVATKLFGLTFEERKDLKGWGEEVRVFAVKNPDGSHRAVFLGDWFNRPSKRSGAWMSALQGGHGLGEGAAPIIYNVCNFARPPAGQPALLSIDEARTLFHEFGHALHGILTEARWPSVAGTNVPRDFVELPSQLYEHWLTAPQVLKAHAVHHRTGEPLPAPLLEKLLAARNFGQGFATVEFAASALVDMAYHAQAEAPEDPAVFEAETLKRLKMPEAIAMRHRTPHFLHVFSGEGYSAGYYSYMWSEVLDADAFAAFEEAGDLFDPATAAKLRAHIYAAGGSQDPEALYTAFRGRMPSPEAMMAKRGLA